MIINGPEQYWAHANSICGISNNVIVICLVIVPILYYLSSQGYDENQMTQHMLYSNFIYLRNRFYLFERIKILFI